MKLEVSRRQFLRLLGAGVAFTLVPAPLRAAALEEGVAESGYFAGGAIDECTNPTVEEFEEALNEAVNAMCDFRDDAGTLVYTVMVPSGYEDAINAVMQCKGV